MIVWQILYVLMWAVTVRPPPAMKTTSYSGWILCWNHWEGSFADTEICAWYSINYAYSLAGTRTHRVPTPAPLLYAKEGR